MISYFSKPVLFIAAITLAACSPKQMPSSSFHQGPPSSQIAFWGNLQKHCGKAYAGKMTSIDPQDTDMAGVPMTMQVNCAGAEIRIPFSVGDNRSRTWVLTTTDTGLRLKHQHNHEDGTPDKVTYYGGDTAEQGAATRQSFPVDEFSKALFLKEGLDVSVTNVWAVEITPKIYAYELKRENRFFRVEFDLSKQIPTPLKPW